MLAMCLFKLVEKSAKQDTYVDVLQNRQALSLDADNLL